MERPVQESQPLAQLVLGTSRVVIPGWQELLPPWPLWSDLSSECRVGRWVWSHYSLGGARVCCECLGGLGAVMEGPRAAPSPSLLP